MEWTVAIGQLDSREIATTPAGYQSLLSWAQELGVPAFAVEGTGSYGAGLVRFLERAGVSVYECERPRRQERRRGKSDLIDAALAARRLLGRERLSLPRGAGRREDLRLLLLERRSAVQARTAALNQLSALLVTAPEHVRERLGALSGERLARPHGSGLGKERWVAPILNKRPDGQDAPKRTAMVTKEQPNPLRELLKALLSQLIPRAGGNIVRLYGFLSPLSSIADR